MSNPLSPAPQSALNTSLPEEDDITWHNPPSSPFVPVVGGEDQENIAPPQDTTVLSFRSACEDSPLKSLETTTPRRSPSKNSRSKSPTKQESSGDSEAPLRDNEGLTVAISMMEDSQTDLTVAESGFVDDDFSMFSAVPNTDLTEFAKLKSPMKISDQDQTPRVRASRTPGTVRTLRDLSPSPTPRGHKSPMLDASETTSLLLDFTQQMEAFSLYSKKSTSRGKISPTKSQTEPQLLSYLNNSRSPGKKGATVPATPGRNSNLLDLLDFELPPPATPRSVPTITIREMESLKSSYLSQISSLTASLSGKEAEAESLKKAVADAERRVGEAQEAIREERNAREHAERQKADWEKRGVEVEEVLKTIRKEIIASEKEREELSHRLEDSIRRADEAESRASEAEFRAAEAESKSEQGSLGASSGTAASSGSPNRAKEDIEKELEKRFDRKVKEVSKELHRLYKEKHNRKMDAQKEAAATELRKKETEWQAKLDTMQEQVNELQLAKEATFSSVLPSDLMKADLKRLEEQTSMIEEQKAKLVGMDEELKTYQLQHRHLLQQLEQERVEKGELVAAAEQLMTLQAEMTSAGIIAPPSAVEDFRKSIPRSSGLRNPGFSGLARPTAGQKSRMMSSIERMGNGRSAE